MNGWFRRGFVQAVLVAEGLFYLVTGALLFFAPRWFFDNIAAYAPYNRHFIGDAGAFVLPLGVALLIAARNPARRLLFIGYAVFSSVMHTANHIYDDVIIGDDVTQAIVNSGSLALMTVALAVAWWLVWRESRA